MYTDSLTSQHSGISNDVLLFSGIGLSLVHQVLPIAGGSPDATCSTLPCAAESPDVVCPSPRPCRCAIGRQRPVRIMELHVQNAPRLTVQDPLAAAGAVVLDCRPPLLPLLMDISGVDLSAIRASTMSAEAGDFPPEREQSFGGGGDLLSLICPELGVTPLMDPGTDLEDELPTPAVSPVTVDHGAAPRSAQADVDIDLVRVIEDVGTLPAMVTPLSDPEGGGLSGLRRGMLCPRLLTRRIE